MFRASNKARS